MVESQTDRYLGRVFGAYRIESLLGEGAGGSVYRATHLELRRPAAVKLLPSGGADREAQSRFRREAKAAARLADPNVARVFDFGIEEDVSYIAQELVEGVSLAAHLDAEGKLSLEEVVSIGAAVAGGLQAIHKEALVHRDLKPENLILTAAEGAKIVDFGLVRVLGENSTQLTRAGTLVGTPLYMAPEQIEGGQVGPSADVYALGCILSRALTGRAPHDLGDENLRAFLQRRMREPAEDVGARRPDLPAEVRDLLGRMMAMDPAARPSGRDVLRTLVAARRTLPGTPEHADVTTQVGMGPLAEEIAADEAYRRWRPRVLAGAAAFALIMVLLGVTAVRTRRTKRRDSAPPATDPVVVDPAVRELDPEPEAEPEPEPEPKTDPARTTDRALDGVAGNLALDGVLLALAELRLDDAQAAIEGVRDPKEARTARWLLEVLRKLNGPEPLDRTTSQAPGEWSEKAPRVGALVASWEPGLSTYGFARLAAEQRNQIALVLHVSRYQRLRRQQGSEGDPESASFLKRERRGEFALLMRMADAIRSARRDPEASLTRIEELLTSPLSETDLGRDVAPWLRMIRGRLAMRVRRAR